MARSSEPTAKRPRISVGVEPTLRRRLRLAAAKRDVTVQRYVLQAIEEQLKEDLGDEAEAMMALTANADPVLAELWDNPRDAEYDRLSMIDRRLGSMTKRDMQGIDGVLRRSLDL